MEIQGRIFGNSRIKKKELGELIVLDSSREEDFIKRGGKRCGVFLFFGIRRKFGKEDGGRAMYLETYSMEELMELIEEKGYCSVEAVEILKEMEQAKKGMIFYSGIVRKSPGKQTRW